MREKTAQEKTSKACSVCSGIHIPPSLDTAQVVVALRERPHHAAGADQEGAEAPAVELDCAEHEPLGGEVQRGDAERADGQVVEAGVS